MSIGLINAAAADAWSVGATPIALPQVVLARAVMYGTPYKRTCVYTHILPHWPCIYNENYAYQECVHSAGFASTLGSSASFPSVLA